MADDRNLEEDSIFIPVSDLPNQMRSLYSIAISLKRIADKLELANKQPILMTADDYSNFLKGKERLNEKP